MAATRSSLSLSSHSSLPLHRCGPHRFGRTSLNLAFLSEPPSPRLVSVRASVGGFESGSGSKMETHSDGVETSSSSSAIDFLTLCHRLKLVLLNLESREHLAAVLHGLAVFRGVPMSCGICNKFLCSKADIAIIEANGRQMTYTTKRKGWINHGIKGPESIADHMYRMSLMALIAGDLPGVNRERCIKIAIVHDIAEAIVGDITPSDGVPKEEKSRREQAALNEMCEVLGGGMRAEEIKELWAEYENNSSIEANLVKDFDKVSY
ncbi:metal-dependent phosphohydrolase [Actinidia rufa]|uniref:Metal-dependent phosphohydrolase n=1 Tax=Actinidia rufa TaxID=165716 RepID=A0A7J0H072_9ERIC|nr:metal-dependent phosphohydrolase [Actinidia rufa]